MTIYKNRMDETMRLMEKFGFLNEAAPSTVQNTNTNQQQDNTGMVPSTQNQQQQNNGDDEENTKGKQKEKESGGLGWLALRDFGRGLNKFFGRDITYPESGLDGEAPGTVLLTVQQSSVNNNNVNEATEEGNGNQTQIVFQIEKGEHNDLVYVTPNGTRLTMCGIPKGKKDRDEEKQDKKPNPTPEQQQQSNNESRNYGIFQKYLNEVQKGRNEQNDDNMVNEPVDSSNGNYGGIVRMGQFWLYLSRLVAGADAKVTGKAYAEGVVSEIHEEFARWFAEQPKEQKMPKLNYGARDTDFGKYLNQSLLRRGNDIIMHTDNVRVYCIKNEKNHYSFGITVYANDGELPLGIYTHTEYEKNSNGYIGFIHCGNPQSNNVLGFQYFSENGSVSFYYSMNGKTSGWLNGGEGVLVDLIREFFKGKTNQQETEEENDDEENEADLEDEYSEGYEEEDNQYSEQEEKLEQRLQMFFYKLSQRNERNHYFIGNGRTEFSMELVVDRNGYNMIYYTKNGTFMSPGLGYVEQNGVQIEKDDVYNVSLSCENGVVSMYQTGEIYLNGEYCFKVDPERNMLYVNVINPILSQMNESLSFNIDKILNEIRRI